MIRNNRWCLSCVLVLLSLAAARAQEPPAPGEPEEAKTYYDLRRSKTRATSLNAERLLTLIKLQEWSDVSGKAKVNAKYVEHDPDLKWVKLEKVDVRDGKQDIKEITVPVEKLSTKCQSRVRQIDKLKAKLDPLLTASDDALPGQTSDPGAPMTDERGVQPGELGAMPPGDPSQFDAGVEGTPPAPAMPSPEPEVFEADPLGFAEMELAPPPSPGDAPEGNPEH
jgi:hypothetical protein